jgi:hypothetical protein
MHRGPKVFGYIDVQGIGGCRRVVGNGGGCVRPVYRAGVSVGIIPQELSSHSGQPRIPIRMLGVEVTRHKDGVPAAQVSGKVRLDQGSAG